MIRVILIVCISSSYSGIFQETGLLDARIGLSLRWRSTSACLVRLWSRLWLRARLPGNQTLSIMLTDQLCGNLENDEQRKVINLEDTAVVVAPLIPWSIAGAVPLASVGVLRKVCC